MIERRPSRPSATLPTVPHWWHVAVVVGGIVASWVVLTPLGHALVKLIYEGRAPAFLNALMSSRGKPIGRFYGMVDDSLIGLHLLLVLIALLWLTRAQRSPWLWFGLFVAADVGFLLLDIKSDVVWLRIWHEWSIPEWSGYFKEILFAVSMYRVFKSTGEHIYLCLSLLGGMMFLDDIARYHETVGRVLAPIVESTRLHEILRVESHFLGEILSLIPYGILGLLGFWFYRRSSPRARRDARFVASLIVLLFVFGVLVDLIPHLGVGASLNESFSMAWIEDFGEMIILSGLAAFSGAVLWRNVDTELRPLGRPITPLTR